MYALYQYFVKAPSKSLFLVVMSKGNWISEDITAVLEGYGYEDGYHTHSKGFCVTACVYVCYMHVYLYVWAYTFYACVCWEVFMST